MNDIFGKINYDTYAIFINKACCHNIIYKSPVIYGFICDVGVCIISYIEYLYFLIALIIKYFRYYFRIKKYFIFLQRKIYYAIAEKKVCGVIYSRLWLKLNVNFK